MYYEPDRYLWNKTQYNYEEYYWVVDGKPIVEYIDEFIKENEEQDLSGSGSFLGLLPAWEGKLIWEWENDFIWELIENETDMNIPILVCEDDCDLSCIVIAASIRKTRDYIYVDRLVYLNRENWDSEKEQKSGILCLEAYTNQDWEKYGDNIAAEKYGSEEYWDWVSRNCYKENNKMVQFYRKMYEEEKI